MSGFQTPASPRRRFHKRSMTGFTPTEIKAIDQSIPIKAREAWTRYAVKEFATPDDLESLFINHVETTLARSMYNCDNLAAYSALSSSIRDKLILHWNKTQQLHTLREAKRIYYLSLEFLMGRALDNAMINLGIKELCGKSVDELGFNLEDVIDIEPDAGLGNGGLGRLAACFVDSLSTCNYPGWGYGLRYNYGIFSQKIVDGYQVEAPDYWLKYGNPWEIPRLEIQIPVDFYGYVTTVTDPKTGKAKKQWQGGEQVLAVAYDFPVPGYHTTNVNNLRLWSSKPTSEFDFQKFNEGEYDSSVQQQQRAESITAVLYPNDNFYQGKELRLKQQYFWVAASLHDIVRRFLKTKKKWSEFPDLVAIQLNDTHPTLAIVELQRILVDLEGLEWDDAWDIVTRTFGYTNHTVMQEALEKWPLELFGNLLPRHLEIIYLINMDFLKTVSKKFPQDRELVRNVSIIEESDPKNIRMANLAVIGSHKVNGVAELHSELIKTTIFKDFVKVFGPEKFTNVTNGITPRRWLKQANPELTDLIVSKLGSDLFLVDTVRMKQIEKFVGDPEFRKSWALIKLHNKERLAKLIKKLTGVVVNPHNLFDIQVKRIHEYKRQQLNIFGIIWRYLQIKATPAGERAKKFMPKVSILGGKAAPGYYAAKKIIKLINSVADVINNDKDVGDLLKVVFVPDYNVSKAEVICPASDISEHISTAGTEASGTSNMKFVLNGGLIIGTVDGANVEITREVGEDQIFLFGNLAEDVEELRQDHQMGKIDIPDSLALVFEEIEKGTFGPYDEYRSLIESVKYNGDFYLVSDDFESYLEAQSTIDKEFKDQDNWVRKSIICVANMGFFSSDRAIQEYAENIWNIEPVSEQV
ncbi:Non-essential glycogen phosphorylase [Brettanomyces bruxellensis]|uniref:Alpha-1,4 glucan phosphorylase n=1 Tax=Dekkera bruxellensis TaxID=5007 RepID=A0A7D9CY63_DEKBR|nr:Non-essential glycogen phosphorylase [Brettanomyces bruxellensis]KAF6010482.1 Non-essential glycogen phosphorylase [Brettanomyces bruxellensis]VUG18073.1 GPH1 [Brettanomyces bruxellensis]